MLFSKLRRFAALALVPGAVLFLAGCPQEEPSPVDSVTETVDEAAEDVGETADDVAEDAEDVAEDAADTVDEATDGE